MDSSVLVGVAVCLLVALLMRWLSKKGNLPPGPWGLPIVGYLPFLSRKVYFDFMRLAKKYGDVFSISMGDAYVVVLNDYDSMKEAFAQEAFIGRPPTTNFDLSKENLESEAFNGLPWIEHRKFSLHMLRDLGFGKTKMEDHILEEVEDLLNHIEQKAEKPFCVYDLLAPSMSNNISALMFGKRLKYDDPTRQMLTRTIKETSRAVGQTIWTIFFPTVAKICRLFGIAGSDKVIKVQRDLKAYIKKEMAEHEESLNSSNIRDFIDGYLVEIEKRKDDPSFCKPVLCDLVGAYFGAGSETVRVTVEFLLLTAAAHQDAQRRIQREIDDVIGRNCPPTVLHQKSMPYTQAFIMELMRWRTIIPVNLLRYAIAPGSIKGYHIPKHSYIMANLWAVHHDQDYWGADADDFRPERLLSEDGKTLKKWDHFIPFSIGRRACPGEPFAKIEIFLYFTSILQRFNVKLPEFKVADFEGDIAIGLTPKPQELIFTKRNLKSYGMYSYFTFL